MLAAYVYVRDDRWSLFYVMFKTDYGRVQTWFYTILMLILFVNLL